MIIPSRNLIVLEPAKCGTHSLREVVKQELGIDKPIAPGHRKLSDLLSHAARYGVDGRTCEVVQIIRDPLERLASAANHLHGQDGSRGVKEILAELSADQNVYRPQVDYADLRRAVTYFRFEDLAVAFSYICGKAVEIVPHENLSHKRFSAAEFDLPQVHDFYAGDMSLYNSLPKPTLDNVSDTE